MAVLALGACDTSQSLLGAAVAGDERLVGNRDPQTLVVGRPSDAITLDPALPTDNESAEVIFQVYDTLVEWEAGTSTVAPGLATSWETDASGTVWTFHLARGVRFHDGTPCDADAVVFSLERQRDPSHAYRPVEPLQYWPSLYRNIQQVEKVDDLTVRITIEQPYSPFLANMAMFPVSIVSPQAVKTYGAEFGDHPVGSGPWMFDSWAKGERLVLRKNPDYWRRDRVPRMNRLVFEVIGDPRQRLIALESGAIDLAVSILPEELQFVDLHPGLIRHEVAANNVSFLAMNMDHPALADRAVRQAIAHAINKEPIVQLAFQGLAITADSPLPPTQWGHHEPATAYAYDPTAAGKLLADARARGVFDPATVLTLYAPSTPRLYLPNPDRVARAIQSNLAEVGIPVELKLLPFAELLQITRNGVHDLCLLGWVGDNGDPDNYLQQLDRDNTQIGSAVNVAFYRDAHVHDLLVRAQQTGDRAAREQLYIEAQDQIALDVPWVPLAHSQVALAARDDVGDLIVNPTGQVIYRAVVRVRR